MTALIEKKATINDVVCIRLTTGEEVVGRLKSDNSTSLTLTKPVLAAIQYDQVGNPVGLAFGPFMTTAGAETFTFLKTALMIEPVKPRDDIAKNYTQATSNLALPPSNGGLIV